MLKSLDFLLFSKKTRISGYTQPAFQQDNIFFMHKVGSAICHRPHPSLHLQPAFFCYKPGSHGHLNLRPRCLHFGALFLPHLDQGIWV